MAARRVKRQFKHCRYTHRTPAKTILCVAVLLSTISFTAQADEQTYFRIITDSGSVQLKATITPKEAKRGYSIVTLGGHILKEVAPEMTAEEYATQSSGLREAERVRREKELQQTYDEELLLRYSTVDDLLAEKKRKLSEFDIRISILYSNLTGLKEKLDKQQARAANAERNGRQVPDYLVTNIEELEAEMQELEATIRLRKSEKTAVSEKYNKDANRLAHLITKFQR